MDGWTQDELSGIGRAEEVEITPGRKAVTVWLVRVGDDLFVRSAIKGREAAWYRAVQRTHQGRISGGGVERAVRFEEVDPAVNDEVDAAYRSKYRGYTGRILDTCLTPEARSTTLRIVPR